MRTSARRLLGALLAAGLTIAAGPWTGTVGRAASAPPPPPRLLSETGLYATGSLAIDRRNRPYSPQYPLWSDGAAKQRWVWLPPGATIDVRNVDDWSFPVGTKFWKEFTFGDRHVETRMLWHATDQGWVFASYRWNDGQTDAVLVPPEGDPAVAEIAPNRRHSIPSVDECRACHDSGRTRILGFSALQLSTDRDPNAIHGEALTPDMITLGTLSDEGRLAPARPELLADPPRIRIGNPRERALLGYLSTNCGMCHNRHGELATLGMVLAQPSHDTGVNNAIATTTGRRSTWQLPGAPDGTSLRIVPGAPEASVLFYRMKSRRPSSQMPPLGTVLPDHEALAALRSWIEEEGKE